MNLTESEQLAVCLRLNVAAVEDASIDDALAMLRLAHTRLTASVFRDFQPVSVPTIIDPAQQHQHQQRPLPRMPDNWGSGVFDAATRESTSESPSIAAFHVPSPQASTAPVFPPEVFNQLPSSVHDVAISAACGFDVRSDLRACSACGGCIDVSMVTVMALPGAEDFGSLTICDACAIRDAWTEIFKPFNENGVPYMSSGVQLS